MNFYLEIDTSKRVRIYTAGPDLKFRKVFELFFVEGKNIQIEGITLHNQLPDEDF